MYLVECFVFGDKGSYRPHWARQISAQEFSHTYLSKGKRIHSVAFIIHTHIKVAPLTQEYQRVSELMHHVGGAPILIVITFINHHDSCGCKTPRQIFERIFEQNICRYLRAMWELLQRKIGDLLAFIRCNVYAA